MAKRTSKKHRDLYQEITDNVIAALERGTAPWRKPWTAEDNGFGVTLPINHISGRPYSGINIMLLWMAGMDNGYTSNRWLTFNGARKLGGHIKAGQHGTEVILFRRIEIEEKNKEGKTEKKQIPLIRSFTVFNLDQCDGITYTPKVVVTTQEERAVVANEAAEALLKAANVTTRHDGGDRAFYRPGSDSIHLPKQAEFHTDSDYYATRMHELTHATGHKKRLDRDSNVPDQYKGSYAFEELVAELGCLFTIAHLGITGTVQNHESYLASWLKALKEDKKAIFKAAALAQKAHQWMLDRLQQPETSDSPQGEDEATELDQAA